MTRGRPAAHGRATEIALVRHGETDWNLQRRIQGATDIPLNDTGRAQARRAARELAGEWSGLYTSPLVRARETGRIIAEAIGLEPSGTDGGLVERAHGEIEGLDDVERAARFPHGRVVPGYEHDDAVVARAMPALQRIAARHPGGRVVVVAHGGLISAVLRRLSDGAVPARGEFVANASVQTLRVDGAGRIELVAARLVSRVG